VVPSYAMRDMGGGSRLMLLARGLLTVPERSTLLLARYFAVHERSNSYFVRTLFTFCFRFFFSAVRVVVTITSTMGT